MMKLSTIFTLIFLCGVIIPLVETRRVPQYGTPWHWHHEVYLMRLYPRAFSRFVFYRYVRNNSHFKGWALNIMRRLNRTKFYYRGKGVYYNNNALSRVAYKIALNEKRRNVKSFRPHSVKNTVVRAGIKVQWALGTSWKFRTNHLMWRQGPRFAARNMIMYNLVEQRANSSAFFRRAGKYHGFSCVGVNYTHCSWIVTGSWYRCRGKICRQAAPFSGRWSWRVSRSQVYYPEYKVLRGITLAWVRAAAARRRRAYLARRRNMGAIRGQKAHMLKRYKAFYNSIRARKGKAATVYYRRGSAELRKYMAHKHVYVRRYGAWLIRLLGNIHRWAYRRGRHVKHRKVSLRTVYSYRTRVYHQIRRFNIKQSAKIYQSAVKYMRKMTAHANGNIKRRTEWSIRWLKRILDSQRRIKSYRSKWAKIRAQYSLVDSAYYKAYKAMYRAKNAKQLNALYNKVRSYILKIRNKKGQLKYVINRCNWRLRYIVYRFHWKQRVMKHHGKKVWRVKMSWLNRSASNFLRRTKKMTYVQFKKFFDMWEASLNKTLRKSSRSVKLRFRYWLKRFHNQENGLRRKWASKNKQYTVWRTTVYNIIMSARRMILHSKSNVKKAKKILTAAKIKLAKYLKKAHNTKLNAYADKLDDSMFNAFRSVKSRGGFRTVVQFRTYFNGIFSQLRRIKGDQAKLNFLKSHWKKMQGSLNKSNAKVKKYTRWMVIRITKMITVYVTRVRTANRKIKKVMKKAKKADKKMAKKIKTIKSKKALKKIAKKSAKKVMKKQHFKKSKKANVKNIKKNMKRVVKKAKKAAKKAKKTAKKVTKKHTKKHAKKHVKKTKKHTKKVKVQKFKKVIVKKSVVDQGIKPVMKKLIRTEGKGAIGKYNYLLVYISKRNK